jgi:hypothetical protein
VKAFFITLYSLLAAFALAGATTGLALASCGENAPGCSASSAPVLASWLSGAGFGAVAICLGLTRGSSDRTILTAIAVTGAIYVAWAIAVVVAIAS